MTNLSKKRRLIVINPSKRRRLMVTNPSKKMKMMTGESRENNTVIWEESQDLWTQVDHEGWVRVGVGWELDVNQANRIWFSRLSGSGLVGRSEETSARFCGDQLAANCGRRWSRRGDQKLIAGVTFGANIIRNSKLSWDVSGFLLTFWLLWPLQGNNSFLISKTIVARIPLFVDRKHQVDLLKQLQGDSWGKDSDRHRQQYWRRRGRP